MFSTTLIRASPVIVSPFKIRRAFAYRLFVGFGLTLISCFISADGADSPIRLATYDTNVTALQVHHELTNAVAKGKGELTRILLSRLPQSLEAPLSLENSDVRKGKSLPAFFLDPRFPGRDFENVMTGARYGRGADEFRASIRLLFVIPQLANAQSVELVDWLVTRGKRLPPTPTDVIASIALGSCSLDRASNDFWNATAPKWRRMLSAKNPVYRLIALQQVRYFEKDQNKAVDSYTRALQEKNTIFQFVAVQELERIGGSEARVAIKKFLDRNPIPDDGTLGFDIDVVVAANEALSRLSQGK